MSPQKDAAKIHHAVSGKTISGLAKAESQLLAVASQRVVYTYAGSQLSLRVLATAGLFSACSQGVGHVRVCE